MLQDKPNQNLLNALRDKRITQKRLAKELKIHPNSLSNKLNGKTPFTVDEAIKINKLLGSRYYIERLFDKDAPVMAFGEKPIEFAELEQNWHCVGKHFYCFLKDWREKKIAGTNMPCSDCKYAMAGLCNYSSAYDRFKVLEIASGINQGSFMRDPYAGAGRRNIY